jgi:16S rRNA (cytidine1402-2'-O)-methyltransferase
VKEGKLYIIGTPIGNMEDITYRAVRILKNDVGLIYCEDTRQTKKLLNHFDINIRTRSLHTHSSDAKINELCDNILSGMSIAYMTDSGTPGISDPGSKLVNAARERGLKIIPIPGASALSTILSVAGYSGKRAIFTGFLSKKEGKITKELKNLINFNGIIVIYESPYRIKKLIKILNTIFPEIDVVIGREMTKLYEEFYYGKISEIYENIDKIVEKGEFTLALINRNEKENLLDI